MKRLIARVFRVVYHLTGSKGFAYGFALSYISALNLIVIYGLCVLLKELAPTSLVLELYAFPYFVATFLAMLSFNFMMAPTYQGIAVERKRKASNGPVILYSAVSLMLFAYTFLADRLF